MKSPNKSNKKTTVFRVFILLIVIFFVYRTMNGSVPEKPPENASTTEYLSSAFKAYRAENYKTAIAYYTKVISSNPKTADLLEAYQMRGKCYGYSKQFEQSLTDFKEAARIDPQSASNQTNLGHAYYDLGQYSEALRCYDEALRIDPGHGSAKFQREETLKQIERLRGRS